MSSIHLGVLTLRILVPGRQMVSKCVYLKYATLQYVKLCVKRNNRSYEIGKNQAIPTGAV